MGLRENTFKEEYRTGDIDLVEVFYRPCLKKSVRPNAANATSCVISRMACSSSISDLQSYEFSLS